jgi:hypothetical protein
MNWPEAWVKPDACVNKSLQTLMGNDEHLAYLQHCVRVIIACMLFISLLLESQSSYPHFPMPFLLSMRRKNECFENFENVITPYHLKF